MRTESLNYLVLLDQVPNIQKVADFYHITPAAISKALTSLENELDLKLVERNRSGTSLTLAGKKIAEATKVYFSQIAITKSEEIFRDFNVSYTIAFINTNGLLTNITPGLENFLLHFNPEVSIDTESFTYTQQRNLFDNNSLSYCLTYFMDGAESQLDDTLLFEPLITGSLYCQIHPNLIDSVNAICLDDLLHLPICYFHNAYKEPCLEKIVHKPFPKVYYALDRMQYLYRIQHSMSFGVTYVPDFVLPQNSDTMHYLPITDGPVMNCGFLSKKDAPPSGQDAKFIALYRSYIDLVKAHLL